MGKTKVNIVGAEQTQEKKKLSYKEKMAQRAAAQASDQVTSESGSQEKPTSLPDQPINSATIKSPIKIQRDGEEVKQTKTKSQAKEAPRGKKYVAAKAKVEDKAYPLAEASKLVKETSYSKFPASVELHLSLNIPNVNTQVVLPFSTGVSKKIEIASEETVKKLEAGKIDFDIVIATAETMPLLVRFAKLLGPRGLMPNPKNGTLVEDPKKALANFGGNNVQVKTEKSFPLVHTVVAKTNQPEEEISANVKAIFEAVGPKTIEKAVISASMGPGIQVQVA